MARYELTLNASSGALARVIALVHGRHWRLGALSYEPAEATDRGRLVLDLESPHGTGLIEAQLGKLYDVLAVRRLDVP